jgi:RNA polymerase sigma factor (sigma-70 family)
MDNRLKTVSRAQEATKRPLPPPGGIALPHWWGSDPMRLRVASGHRVDERQCQHYARRSVKAHTSVEIIRLAKLVDAKKFTEILAKVVEAGSLDKGFRNFSRGSESPEDHRQNFLCQFWERMSRRNFEGVDCTESYIHGSARNFRADSIRRRKRARKRELQVDYKGDSNELVDHVLGLEHGDSDSVTAHQTADEDSALIENSAAVNRAIEKMPKKRRRVMQLRLEGFSNEEVAQKLGILRGTVVNHFRHGMRDIYEAMGAGSSPTLPSGSTGDGEI